MTDFADIIGTGLAPADIGALADVPSGVTAGTYSSANVTVDSRGRITHASNGTLAAPANIKDAPYNAKGDGKSVTDATITTATTTLSSTQAAFTTADVGKTILVQGAAAAGADLITTISSVAGGVATLAAAAGTTIAANGRAYYGTDDTVAIQAAIDHVTAAGGGDVLFPTGWYIIAGAFKNTGVASGVTANSPTLAYRAQLTIPDVGLTQPKVPLRLVGGTPLSWLDFPPTQIGRTGSAGGAFLISLSNGETYATTSKLPSMLGGPDPANMLIQPVKPTNVALTIDGVGFITPRNPQLCAVNLAGLAHSETKHLYVSTFDWVDNFATTPTRPVGIGVFFPAFGNWSNISADQIVVEGYYCGFVASEHLMATNLDSFYNYISLSWTQMLHVGKINGLDCGEGHYGIAYNDFTGAGLGTATQPALLQVDGMEIEAVATSNTFINTVYDPGNKVTANIRYHVYNNNWTMNGGVNVLASPVGDGYVSSTNVGTAKVTGAVQTTVSTTYTDLTTVGPAVTVVVPPSGRVLAVMRCGMSNSTAGAYALCGLTLSGANVLAASEDYLFIQSATASQEVGHGVVIPFTGLTPGSTTFTMKYRVTAGTGNFGFRYLTVLPL